MDPYTLKTPCYTKYVLTGAVNCRANLDGQMSDGPTCRLDPGRVVVGLPDMAMLEYLREQVRCQSISLFLCKFSFL